jgi:hypothetical protein
MIDTREELINALYEAAEIEHGLMLQYLFAAFSCKRRVDEGITPLQQSLIAEFEGVLLKVAHEEMYHLANVCNLLSAIGSSPNFGRPNFPQPMKAYYPFDFQLEKLNDDSMYRFIVFELPEGEPPPPSPGRLGSMLAGATPVAPLAAAPDPITYNHVGELYSKIQQGFRNIPESELFIGPRQNRDYEDWGLRLKLHLVSDLETALNAIKVIVEEGEGTTGNRENSHYKRFIDLRARLWKETNDSPGFSGPSGITVGKDLVHRSRKRSLS